MTGATQNMNFLSIFTSSYVDGTHKNVKIIVVYWVLLTERMTVLTNMHAKPLEPLAYSCHIFVLSVNLFYVVLE